VTNRTLVLALMVFCLLTGLSTSCRQMEPAGARQDPVAASEYPNVQVEKELERWVVVDYSRIVYDPATNVTPAAVTVPIRSVARKLMKTQYRVLWFDEAGRQIGESEWKYVELAPAAETQFSANSISNRAVDWRMEIRVAR